MKKLAKIKLTAELLEAAVEEVRTSALNKIRWSNEYHLECEDVWNNDELLTKLTPEGGEVLTIVEQLAAKLEELI